MHSQLLPPLDEITHIDLSERVDRISAFPYALDPGIPVTLRIIWHRVLLDIWHIGATSCPTDDRAFSRRVDRFYVYPLRSVDLENSPDLRSKHGSEVEHFRR